MYDKILSVLQIMGWLGIVLAILVFVNTICGVIKNMSEGQSFSWSVLLKGLGKSLVFYICSVFIAVSFTMLPFINDMISAQCGMELISGETLDILSSTAVLSVVIAVVVSQGKKALEGIIELMHVKVANTMITGILEEDEDIEENEEGLE